MFYFSDVWARYLALYVISQTSSFRISILDF